MTTPWQTYASPGPMSAPGEWAAGFSDLPVDVPQLCRIIQGLMLHVFWAERMGVELSPARKEEVQLRTVARQVARILELDPRPLDQARSPDRRLVGNCRDFSLMLTAMLRHHGVPARARCGFGRYFLPNHFEDHWVCEVWDAAQQRWILVDAQLDEFQCAQLAVTFDPLDVPRDQFVSGGKAWQMCRGGEADPDAFGIFDMHGLWFVRGNLVRDVAALNKLELLPWDSWGMIEASDEDLSVGDLELLDRLAALTAGDVPELDQVHALYAHETRVRVPATIASYTQAGVQTVDLTAFEAP